MSVHVDYVFMLEKSETLEKTKYKINMEFNIQESGKVKMFLGVYYEWGRDAKGVYTKMTMKKAVRKLLSGYNNHTRIDVKLQKTPGAPITTLSKSVLEEPQDIDNYRSFVVQLMRYKTKMEPDVANVTKELSVHRSHTGTED